jgi:hypothetical protein
MLAAFLPAGGCDPVHADAVAALGPEAPGVRPGPLHRPGQTCTLCHDGAFGDPQRFSVAGTVYRTPTASLPSVGAEVTLVDTKGATTTRQTNAAGNFYTTPSEYDPSYPVQVTVRGPAGELATMQTLIEGNGTTEPNGGCASCHFDPAGPSSPGRIAVTLDDGGAPP